MTPDPRNDPRFLEAKRLLSVLEKTVELRVSGSKGRMLRRLADLTQMQLPFTIIHRLKGTMIIRRVIAKTRHDQVREAAVQLVKLWQQSANPESPVNRDYRHDLSDTYTRICARIMTNPVPVPTSRVGARERKSLSPKKAHNQSDYSIYLGDDSLDDEGSIADDTQVVPNM